jgi:predicted glycosyltransferase
LFAPIIEGLKKQGYSVLVTARDCFQVRELAALFGVEHKLIGHHYGKHKISKLAGLCVRTVQLLPTVWEGKPDIAVSHGSRSQLMLAALLRIPSMVIFDYEFAKGLGVFQPRWVMAPQIIAEGITGAKSEVMQYPGIKEDAYVPRFKPDPSIRTRLGLSPEDLVVTLRPPANEAHYHNAESEVLLDAVLERLKNNPNTKVILLPRNQRQEASIRKTWPDLFETGKMQVPAKAVDGLNLIWYSDLVISGGGTMNREAAALGVPVYSIFRGKIGAVDRELARTSRLHLLESVSDVQTKLDLRRWRRPAVPNESNPAALEAMIHNITTALASVR